MVDVHADGTMGDQVVKASVWDWKSETSSSMPDAMTASILVVIGVVGIIQSVMMKKALKTPPNTDGYVKLDGGEDGVDIESAPDSSAPSSPPTLTAPQLFRILKPYFWPSRRSEDWVANRIRCVSTWLAVAG